MPELLCYVRRDRGWVGEGGHSITVAIPPFLILCVLVLLGGGHTRLERVDYGSHSLALPEWMFVL